MSNDASFVGIIPQHYDQGLGPMIFVDHAATSRNAPPPLIAAGFTGINAAVVSLDKEVPDAAGFARAATYGNLLIDQIRTRGGVEPELIVGALAREYRREFGADPGRMPLQAIVFSATKRS
jgi:fructose 1,6-bisphosphatase